ncbi:hypothetical protein [Bradyrhizobium sp.]|uniref:hypothetical protein n=1 Tax=Bradyrhizobium sp. TaxID=376 RepID=UPI002D313F7D|nr:hypothetical protein [Bradyrhizobium sp.]HZR75562.1 hypothetical protein [Bradyrhizobium sp.]
MPNEIMPYVGVGALRFGMTPAQVHQILGAPRFSRRDTHRLREMYGAGGPALTFKAAAGSEEPKLAEIAFTKAATDVIYRGTNLFSGERPAVVTKLYNDDSQPKEVSGTLVFPRLGITLTGFHAGPEESMAVTAFAPGIWDTNLIGAKPFKLG